MGAQRYPQYLWTLCGEELMYGKTWNILYPTETSITLLLLFYTLPPELNIFPN